MAMTPMMLHYLETKKSYPDCILFYRLGDFYEMFYDDAKTASRELELTLTGKDCGMEERAPMCGVPFHAADGYIARLVKKGYKVAVAEQMEDPRLAKGLVKREVIKVVTPGTITAAGALEEGRNNYLVCVVYAAGSFGICAADISTGSFLVTEADSVKRLTDELNRYSPSEVLLNRAYEMSGAPSDAPGGNPSVSVSYPEDFYFSDENTARILKDHFHAASLEALGLKDFPEGSLAAGAAMQYLYDTQKNTCDLITELKTYRSGEYMIIDSSSRRNLELVETMREKEKRGTLLWVLDHTGTAMGARLLRSWVEQPLIRKKDIDCRLDAVEELKGRYIDRQELKEYLAPVYDMERLMGRISSGSATPRDMVALRQSLEMLPPVKSLLQSFQSPLLKDVAERLDTLEDVCGLIARAIREDPPLTVREGGIIRDGYHEKVDRLRVAGKEGKSWLASLEEGEREKTGIKNLRIKFNKVFGYYFEVTNSFLKSVPDYFIRKQTLTNAERFITPELQKLEETILGSEEKLLALEYDLFTEVREQVADQVRRIQESARAVAETDALVSLAETADRFSYVRPVINENGVIRIHNGRHPVVERMMDSGRFVANDTFLDGKENRVSIITGPNMAGKSTYMRQTALIVLMAQMGSFVPASEAEIGICDRIFTRVGASDDLASGQSTFMVEMTEVANILRNATKHSLVILDEIGRGTSTFDGLAIAWAVVEHVANPRILGAKTLFATHYHELTELEGTIPGVNNYCIAVKEQGEDIVFLRKIVRGGADRSYGIQVARLAGVPQTVITRAKELAEELSGADIAARAGEIAAEQQYLGKKGKRRKAAEDGVQMSLFDVPEPAAPESAPSPVEREILEADLSRMTPIEALNMLYRLQETVQTEENSRKEQK